MSKVDRLLQVWWGTGIGLAAVCETLGSTLSSLEAPYSAISVSGRGSQHECLMMKSGTQVPALPQLATVFTHLHGAHALNSACSPSLHGHNPTRAHLKYLICLLSAALACISPAALPCNILQTPKPISDNFACFPQLWSAGPILWARFSGPTLLSPSGDWKHFSHSPTPKFHYCETDLKTPLLLLVLHAEPCPLPHPVIALSTSQNHYSIISFSASLIPTLYLAWGQKSSSITERWRYTLQTKQSLECIDMWTFFTLIIF